MTVHVPHNLPVEPNPFVGRARDLSELGSLVRDERVITLSGVGGIGKSRLSLRVAAQASARFADGVWLVEPARVGDPALMPSVPAAGPRQGGLTTREREIAALLTRGLSNRAIGVELVISPATVARHVANIMDKLGFDTRSQIAVWAAEHGRETGRS
ncbi:hypothetical protein GCM10022224_046180 [Nonomuraea antimicrobica]|uniref:HTH luxR-type domain-containing protein n=1 Tax=Nonomuraea antimicrobica TaxID=561173 RepID=A0ABP7C533_9ACTN